MHGLARGISNRTKYVRGILVNAPRRRIALAVLVVAPLSPVMATIYSEEPAARVVLQVREGVGGRETRDLVQEVVV